MPDRHRIGVRLPAWHGRMAECKRDAGRSAGPGVATV